MKKSMDHLKKMNLLSESKGAVIVDLEQYGLIPAVVQKVYFFIFWFLDWFLGRWSYFIFN